MTADNLDSRIARMQDAISCEKGDRVPVWLFMDYKFPCRYKEFIQEDYHTRIEKRAEGEVMAMKAGRKYWEDKAIVGSNGLVQK